MASFLLDQWYKNTLAAMTKQLWKDFGLDSNAVMVEPSESVQATDEPNSTEEAEPPQVQNTGGSKSPTKKKVNRPGKDKRKRQVNLRSDRLCVPTKPNQAKKRERKHEDRSPCLACGGKSHSFTRHFRQQHEGGYFQGESGGIPERFDRCMSSDY